MSIRRFLSWLIIAAIVFPCVFTLPVHGQLPFLPKINLETLKLNQNSGATIVSGCVRLDGLCIFQILDQKAYLSQRIKFTEQRLQDIGHIYFEANNPQLKVWNQAQGNQQTIYVGLDELTIPVLTLNNQDAARRGVNLEYEAQRIVTKIEQGLQEAQQQRQKPFLIRQAKMAGIIAIAIFLVYFLSDRWLQRSRQVKEQLIANIATDKFSSELTHRKKINLQDVKYRLVQFAQVLVWVGGIIWILGLFPHTRTTQLWIITFVRIPLRIALVVFVTYILIRLSYAVLNRVNSIFGSEAIEHNYVFSPEINRRLRIRINTISRLIRGIVGFLWICVGIVVALAVIGVNITPILAGAGILGLAFSFASQSLIKDALNGFFIILEDQYAVGDVVTIGDSGGVVENLNLRITQLRDAEGRLITLANSQINNVANHSNGWSRSDLRIPVAYQANIDEAIAIVDKIAVEISEDLDWQEKVIEPPQILGVEDFSEHGVVIRLWFKTEPLKQWEVAREFRRRIKIAFETAGIPLSLAQQQIWFQNTKSEFLENKSSK